MAQGKYDKYIVSPPHMQIKAESDGRVVFDGLMVRHTNLGYNMTMGLQFVRKPFVSNNPTHTHNFQEFLKWSFTWVKSWRSMFSPSRPSSICLPDCHTVHWR